jgi:hypothetical protein
MYVHGSGESPLIAGTESEDRLPKDTTTLYTMQLLHSWEVIFVTYHGPTSSVFLRQASLACTGAVRRLATSKLVTSCGQTSLSLHPVRQDPARQPIRGASRAGCYKRSLHKEHRASSSQASLSWQGAAAEKQNLFRSWSGLRGTVHVLFVYVGRCRCWIATRKKRVLPVKVCAR